MFEHAIISTSSPIAVSMVSVGSSSIGAPSGVFQNTTVFRRSETSAIGRSPACAAHSASLCADALAIVVPGRRKP